jgi:magnesium transporter
MNETKKEVKKEPHRESAERLMSLNIPKINFNQTISDIRKLISKNNFDFIDYIYVINDKNILVGTLSIKKILKENKNIQLKKIMNKNLISVRPHTDQEKVAMLALKNNLKAVPVIDKENKLMGVISSHVLLNILHNEGIEDVLRSAGIRKFKDPAKDIIHASAYTHFKKRLPWLIIGLIGGIMAAIIVGLFENILNIYILLAIFVPAVVYMADAVGSQAQTIFIRSMALDKELSYWHYAFRELKINFFLGICLGLIFYIIVLIGWGENFFAIIISISILATVILSMAISILLPIIFSKMNFDPAITTGPFATAVRDLTSLLIYFIIAQIMIMIFI